MKFLNITNDTYISRHKVLNIEIDNINDIVQEHEINIGGNIIKLFCTRRDLYNYIMNNEIIFQLNRNVVLNRNALNISYDILDNDIVEIDSMNNIKVPMKINLSSYDILFYSKILNGKTLYFGYMKNVNKNFVEYDVIDNDFLSIVLKYPIIDISRKICTVSNITIYEIESIKIGLNDEISSTSDKLEYCIIIVNSIMYKLKMLMTDNNRYVYKMMLIDQCNIVIINNETFIDENELCIVEKNRNSKYPFVLERRNDNNHKLSIHNMLSLNDKYNYTICSASNIKFYSMLNRINIRDIIQLYDKFVINSDGKIVLVWYYDEKKLFVENQICGRLEFNDHNSITLLVE